MANPLDINKSIGEVAKLNEEVKNLTETTGKLLENTKAATKELGKVKGLAELNKKLNDQKTAQLKIEKANADLLLKEQKLVDAKIKQQGLELKNEQSLNKVKQESLKVDKLKRDAQIKENKETERLIKNKQREAAASKKAAKATIEQERAYVKLNKQHVEALKKAKDLAAQFGINSKQAKKAADAANVLDKRLKNIDSGLGQSQRKVGGYFKQFTTSLISVGAGFLSINAAIKVFKSILKTVFLGTQDNIDFFNQKLENVKGQFAVLTDSVSNFGQSLVEAFKDSDSNVNKLLTPLLKANPIFTAIKLNLEALKKLFPETAAAMEQNGKDAELLQQMMDELNEKEVIYIGTRAELIKVMRLSRLEAKKAGDDDAKALEFIDKAINAEKELMKLEMSFAVERSRIANERLNLSISTRQDRKNAALLAAKVIELEVASIKKLTTLETERLSLSRRLERQNKKTTTTVRENTEAINEYNSELKSLGISEIEFTKAVADEKFNIVSENIAKTIAANKIKLDQIEADEKASEERKREIRQAFIDTVSSGANVLFDLAQSQRDRELDGIRSNYAAQIEAAGENTALKEKLARELAVKEAEIQRQQAQSERNQALFNIALSTAQAIAQAGVNIPLAALAGTLGAIQVAAVLSQPLPEIPGFFKGTESAPAGLAHIAEKGAELLTMPSGESLLVNEPSLMNLEAGTKVKTAEQTTDILNKAIYNDIAVNGNEGIENRLDKLNRSINNQAKEVTIFDDDGIKRHLAKGNSITNYQNRRGRK